MNKIPISDKSYKIQWQHLEDIFTNLQSPKLFKIFVSADSRNFFPVLVYHYCAFGPGDNYDGCQRCHRWLCEYLLLGSPEVCFHCDLSEVEHGDSLEIVEWRSFGKHDIKLFCYLMINTSHRFSDDLNNGIWEKCLTSPHYLIFEK